MKPLVNPAPLPVGVETLHSGSHQEHVGAVGEKIRHAKGKPPPRRCTAQGVDHFVVAADSGCLSALVGVVLGQLHAPVVSAGGEAGDIHGQGEGVRLVRIGCETIEPDARVRRRRTEGGQLGLDLFQCRQSVCQLERLIRDHRLLTGGKLGIVGQQRAGVLNCHVSRSVFDAEAERLRPASQPASAGAVHEIGSRLLDQNSGRIVSRIFIDVATGNHRGHRFTVVGAEMVEPRNDLDGKRVFSLLDLERSRAGNKDFRGVAAGLVDVIAESVAIRPSVYHIIPLGTIPQSVVVEPLPVAQPHP